MPEQARDRHPQAPGPAREGPEEKVFCLTWTKNLIPGPAREGPEARACLVLTPGELAALVALRLIAPHLAAALTRPEPPNPARAANPGDLTP